MLAVAALVPSGCGGKLRPWSWFANGPAERRFDLEAWLGHVEGGKSPVGARMYAARTRVRNAGSSC